LILVGTEARRCPCGTALPYSACCEPLHQATREAVTAEQLMRSRYSAFVLGDVEYLRRSWHSSTRPRRVRVDPAVRWTELEIVSTSAGGPFDAEGFVEFAAHHDGAVLGVLRERSKFVRDEGHWRYLGSA
jgi:SEC-C motif-containing protein